MLFYAVKNGFITRKNDEERRNKNIKKHERGQ